MEYDLIILNGLLIDPSIGFSQKADLAVKDGKIAGIFSGKGLPKREINKHPSDVIIDAAGCVVVPGLIDIHVHLREPGREDEETIRSGMRAAAAGGFTSVCCMPNTQPAIDNQETVKFIVSQAQGGDCHVYCVGAITKGRKGVELAEIGDLVKAGVVAISDDGSYVQNPAVMRRGLAYARMFDIPVISHAEDTFLAGDSVMNESFESTRLGMPGSPAVAEEIAVIRDIKLARLTDCRLHIAHVSTAGAVEAIREAKAAGVKVTAEVAPHHFTLTDAEIGKCFDSNLRVNPPLRTEADRQAVIAGLVDGTIDCIASDHAPHTDSEKDVEFDQAPPGMIGLETSVCLALSELVDKGYLNISDVIQKMTVNPARVIGLPVTRLERGQGANITVIDPDQRWTIKEKDFRSKSKNSPFIGRRVKGRVSATIMDGRITFRR